MPGKFGIQNHRCDNDQQRNVVATEHPTAQIERTPHFALVPLAEDSRNQMCVRQISKIDPLRIRMLLYIVLAQYILLDKQLKVILVTRIDKHGQGKARNLVKGQLSQQIGGVFIVKAALRAALGFHGVVRHRPRRGMRSVNSLIQIFGVENNYFRAFCFVQVEQIVNVITQSLRRLNRASAFQGGLEKGVVGQQKFPP
ncbi:rh136 [macacine betaherpesvirus 3]|uniref:Rh136 n=1 Tax=Rhesus cytomegalovirus (strain 68-1) TaxID=47929 RepID=Q7TFK4_RHCM6|nr:rh136 [macacine betaherpesvirus 3]AAP50660.1 rh136 [macacine betaherpesvirus 3]